MTNPGYPAFAGRGSSRANGSNREELARTPKCPSPLQGRVFKSIKMTKESSQIPVSPSRPPAPYFGGKRLLAKRIVERINSISHTLYAEPFVGMGGVFLRRNSRPKTEVINDRSKDVAGLFRILQRHYPQFMDVLKWQLTTRADFERLNETNADTLTDLERAARFLYLQRTAFGGKISGRSFGITRTGPARFDLYKLAGLLEEVHERLSGVVIECLPYADFIRRYDRDGALFYLDPPYWDCESDYGAGMFSRDDFGRLAETLSTLKGRFIMSINDKPGVREVFARFNAEPVEVQYSVMGGSGARPFSELLISN